MRRIAYILLIFLQVSLVMFTSSLEWLEKEDATHALILAHSSKKQVATFIESDLKDTEGLFYTQARERDSRPLEFIAEEISDSPWTPLVFLVTKLFLGPESPRKLIVSLLLTDLPPPAIV
ncbi:hypothetical protein [Leptospira wolffii]|nr:hypothetical protein [Leptospira wolffii]